MLNVKKPLWEGKMPLHCECGRSISSCGQHMSLREQLHIFYSPTIMCDFHCCTWSGPIYAKFKLSFINIYASKHLLLLFCFQYLGPSPERKCYKKQRTQKPLLKDKCITIWNINNEYSVWFPVSNLCCIEFYALCHFCKLTGFCRSWNSSVFFIIASTNQILICLSLPWHAFARNKELPLFEKYWNNMS